MSKPLKTKAPRPDHKEKPLNKKQLEIANVLRYMDERMISLVEQIRAVAIAANVSPETFQKAFVDQKAQDDFFVRLHAAEDIYELQEKKRLADEDAKLGKPAGIAGLAPSLDPKLRNFAIPEAHEPEVLQGEQGGAPISNQGSDNLPVE